MTPKEKAEELVESFMLWKFQRCELSKKQAKQCALIAVDEMIKELRRIQLEEDVWDNMPIGYWDKVKKEIKKL